MFYVKTNRRAGAGARSQVNAVRADGIAGLHRRRLLQEIQYIGTPRRGPKRYNERLPVSKIFLQEHCQ